MSDGESAPAYRTMRELASSDRPRERLLQHGPDTLSDADLIAIILGSGIAGQNVVEVARNLLDETGGLPGLVRVDTKALQRARGLGPARAAQVAAAIELGRRMQQLGPEARPMMRSPEAVFAHFAGRYIGKTKEELFVIALDTRGRMLGAPARVHGAVNSVPARAIDVFREAIVNEAISILLVHNHPSGDPRPSPADLTVTKELAAAGKLLGIDVIDHVIIGAGVYLSFREQSYVFR
ncbi:MAG: DNA repair protein RadC [Dehalococcoidia bacterium]